MAGYDGGGGGKIIAPVLLSHLTVLSHKPWKYDWHWAGSEMKLTGSFLILE